MLVWGSCTVGRHPSVGWLPLCTRVQVGAVWDALRCHAVGLVWAGLPKVGTFRRHHHGACFQTIVLKGRCGVDGFKVGQCINGHVHSTGRHSEEAWLKPFCSSRLLLPRSVGGFAPSINFVVHHTVCENGACLGKDGCRSRSPAVGHS